jgi:hypothetical protein
MKKITCVLAILAAASTAALAKDLKQGKQAPAPAVVATQMSDAEMDKVTAGQGFGVETAYFSGSAPLFVLNQVNLVTQGDENAAVNVAPGHGMSTRY